MADRSGAAADPATSALTAPSVEHRPASLANTGKTSVSKAPATKERRESRIC